MSQKSAAARKTFLKRAYPSQATAIDGKNSAKEAYHGYGDNIEDSNNQVEIIQQNIAENPLANIQPVCSTNPQLNNQQLENPESNQIHQSDD